MAYQAYPILKSKKALRERIAAGEKVTLVNTSLFSDGEDILIFGNSANAKPGTYIVEGPDPLGGKPNMWYAQVEVDKMGLAKVKK